MAGPTGRSRPSQAQPVPRRRPDGRDKAATAPTKATHGSGAGATKSATKNSPPTRKQPKEQPRASTLLGEVTVLDKDQRPGKGLWWLAGGRTRGSRGVPTAGELRDRRKVEQVNRDAVGFLGTILGVRAVNRVPGKAVPNQDAFKKVDAKKHEKGESKATGKRSSSKEARERSGPKKLKLKRR